jgi:hypothetical protein
MSDRGMKKWAPFSSLIEQNQELANVRKQKNKIDKPIISSDTSEKIEYQLNNYDKRLIEILYFEEGYLYQTIGIIKKIDIIRNLIFINNKAILINNIIDIN